MKSNFLMLERASVPLFWKHDLEHHHEWIFREIYRTAYPNGALRSPVERISAMRLARLIPLLVQLRARVLGDKQAKDMTDQEIKGLQIAALFHDSGCEDPENKINSHWDKDSADNCAQYLIKVEFPAKQAELVAEAIKRGKGNRGLLEASLLSDAALLNRVFDKFRASDLTFWPEDPNRQPEIQTVIRRLKQEMERWIALENPYFAHFRKDSPQQIPKNCPFLATLHQKTAPLALPPPDFIQGGAKTSRDFSELNQWIRVGQLFLWPVPEESVVKIETTLDEPIKTQEDGVQRQVRFIFRPSGKIYSPAGAPFSRTTLCYPGSQVAGRVGFLVHAENADIQVAKLVNGQNHLGITLSRQPLGLRYRTLRSPYYCSIAGEELVDELDFGLKQHREVAEPDIEIHLQPPNIKGIYAACLPGESVEWSLLLARYLQDEYQIQAEPSAPNLKGQRQPSSSEEEQSLPVFYTDARVSQLYAINLDSKKVESLWRAVLAQRKRILVQDFLSWGSEEAVRNFYGYGQDSREDCSDITRNYPDKLSRKIQELIEAETQDFLGQRAHWLENTLIPELLAYYSPDQPHDFTLLTIRKLLGLSCWPDVLQEGVRLSLQDWLKSHEVSTDPDLLLPELVQLVNRSILLPSTQRGWESFIEKGVLMAIDSIEVWQKLFDLLIGSSLESVYVQKLKGVFSSALLRGKIREDHVKCLFEKNFIQKQWMQDFFSVEAKSIILTLLISGKIQGNLEEILAFLTQHPHLTPAQVVILIQSYPSQKVADQMGAVRRYFSTQPLLLQKVIKTVLCQYPIAGATLRSTADFLIQVLCGGSLASHLFPQIDPLVIRVWEGERQAESIENYLILLDFYSRIKRPFPKALEMSASLFFEKFEKMTREEKAWLRFRLETHYSSSAVQTENIDSFTPQEEPSFLLTQWKQYEHLPIVPRLQAMLNAHPSHPSSTRKLGVYLRVASGKTAGQVKIEKLQAELARVEITGLESIDHLIDFLEAHDSHFHVRLNELLAFLANQVRKEYGKDDITPDRLLRQG